MTAPPLSPAPARPATPRHVRVENVPLGIVMMLGSVLLFSVMNVLVKLLSETYPVIEVTFFRNAMALIPVAVVISLQGGWVNNLRTERPMGHVWRSVVGLTAMSLTFWSFNLLPLGDAVALNFSAPLFLTALSVPLLGERVGIYRWSAVLVGFVGVLIMVQPSGEMLTHLGALVALGAAFCQSFAMVAIRQLSKTERANTIVFYFTAITTLILALVMPFVWVTPRSLTDFALLSATGVLGGGAQLFLTRAYSLAPAAVVAPFNYAALLWAVLFGWLLWNEMPTLHMMAGAAVVAVSGLYILHRETRRRLPPSPPAMGGGGD
ncbi:DMT family transporter [Azospirillum argentinense]